MPGGWHGRRLRRRAIADHDVSRLQLRLAQGAAELDGVLAQPHRRGGTFGPHPHRGRLSAQRDDRMHRARGLHIQGKSRAPDLMRPRCRGLAAAVARNLELRHRRALRRGERNLEVPARHAGVDPNA